MIPTPKAWTAKILLEGGTLLTPREGMQVGAIRYLERLAPIQSVAALLEAQLASDPAFELLEVEGTEELVTHEGEHAMLVRLAGRLGDRRVQRDIGYVFCDATYARVGGVCLDPARFEEFSRTVRQLVLEDCHFLGVRRRRFSYQAPAEWRVLEHGAIHELMAPGFPADPSSIQIWSAMPMVAGAWPSLGEVVEECARDDAQPVRTARGLIGRRWVSSRLEDGTHMRREIVVLEDERYAYFLRLDAVAEDLGHRAAFQACVDSVRPIPRPTSGASVPSVHTTSLLSHWA